MNQDGFALLAVLLLVLATSATALSLAPSPELSASLTAPVATTESRLDGLAQGVIRALHATGSAPTDGTSSLPWMRACPNPQRLSDPYQPNRELTITALPNLLGARVTGVGPDRVAGTGDDISLSSATIDTGIARTRPRLRSLRALYLNRWFAPYPLSSSDRARLASAVTTWTRSQRAIHYASTAEQISLAASRDAAAAQISALMLAYSVPPPPTRVDGPGGLADDLGISDSLCVDGFGQRLEVHPQVGFVSLGADGLGGTLDDQ